MVTILMRLTARCGGQTLSPMDDEPSKQDGSGPVNAGRGQDGRFRKGFSGNPKGMLKGTRHRATRIVDAIMFENLKPIATVLAERARAGEPWAVIAVTRGMLPKRS